MHGLIMNNIALQDRLLVSIIVSPMADFSGADGKNKRNSLENRIRELNAIELSLLNKELDKILKVTDANETFTEKETGVLLISDKATNKKSLYSLFFSSVATSIIEKMTEARKHLLEYIHVKQFKTEIDKQFKIDKIAKSEVRLDQELESLKDGNKAIEEKNKYLSRFVEKIKNDKNHSKSQEFLISLLVLFTDKDNLYFDANKTNKLIAILQKTLITSLPFELIECLKQHAEKSDLLSHNRINQYTINELIEKIVLPISSKLINSKIEENKSIIKYNNEKINELQTLKIRNAQFKNNTFDEKNWTETTIINEIINALETADKLLMPSKNFQEICSNLELAIKTSNSAFGNKYIENEYFKNYNNAIVLLKKFVIEGDHESVKSLSSYVHANTAALSLMDQQYQEQLESLERYFLETNSDKNILKYIEDYKMEYTLKFIPYLKNLIPLTNGIIIQETNLNQSNSNSNCIFSEIDLEKKDKAPENSAVTTIEKLYDFSSETFSKFELDNISPYTPANFSQKQANTLVPVEDELDIFGEEELIDLLVPLNGTNNTSFEDRRSLITCLLKDNPKTGIEFQFLKDEQWRVLTQHPLVQIIYQNFYFIMKGKGMIKTSDDNWGGLVFMKEGCWEKLLGEIQEHEFNVLRNEALQLTIKGTTLTQ
jgi:hypothetical protein